DTWYANRLRVEVIGATAGEAQVQLADERGGELSSVEELDNLAILHSDPPAGTGVVASISVPPNSRWDVVATWPSAASGQVTRMRFAAVPFAGSGHATLALGPDPIASLLVEGAGDGGSDLALEPSETETFEATWDAPDLVWIGTVLPAHQVGTGLLIVLLASVVPTLVYVGTLYWVDRYEKEPKRLLAATFLWGAIPALALALAAELFFRLPPDLIGPHALEAARLGLIAPLLQEILKGAAVLFISWRYQQEFDNVLDGIIYGAMVGFGFAMTGNLLSYAGSFALWGFDGLSVSVFAEGLAYGMNHALYTAVFGAGLGFARLAQKRRQRWVLSVGGFVLAVATHALHSLLARNLLGLNVVTVLTTGAGALLVGIVTGWSLARQHRCLMAELVGEVPDALYRTLTAPGGRSRAQWRALWTGGISEWRRAQRLHEGCTELAFKKMQRQRQPDESKVIQEIKRLRQEISALIEQQFPF
ncbi:MAG: PrsW family intramembrane metalloprotease, partial [Chloroflexota bacterium]|nr:PrsW family intramembrane metalloprotease [Chloroflexota bacterium]